MKKEWKGRKIEKGERKKPILRQFFIFWRMLTQVVWQAALGSVTWDWD